MIPLLIVALLAGPVLAACTKNCEDHYGVCACDQPPTEFTVTPNYKPSDEKPSKHPQPAWERGEVKADMPSSLQAQDAKQDQDQVDAIHSGKHAAGLE